MATGRNIVGFNVDTSAGEQLVGFMQQISQTMSTPAHIGPVLKYVHAELADEFVMHMQSVAPSRSSEFHHVYEWNKVGDPTARLWKDVLRGGGNNRVATFEWRASKSIVPVRQNLPVPGSSKGPYGDPSNKPKQIHVFVWKAPVMEYGENIEIAPKRGKFIVYFTGPVSQGNSNPIYQELKFSSTPITIENPGGALVKGAFTREYVRWWAHGGSQSVFHTRMNKVLNMKTKEMVKQGLATIGSRSRKRTFAMQTVGSSAAAIATGRQAADVAMMALQNNYIEAAKAREAFLP